MARRTTSAAVEGEVTAAAVSGTHLWLVLMKAHRALARHAARSVGAMDLCLSDFATMEMLLHRGPQAVSAIGKRIELTSGAITTAVDRLELRGLVARSASADDRRSVVVSLTARGRTLIERAFAGHQRVMDDAAEALTAPERATLLRLLKKLGRSAEAKLAEGDEGSG